MDIQLKSEEGCVKTFHLTVPSEEIQPLFEEAAREVKAKAALPGFRAGKAPLELIKSRFRKEIREEILEHHLPKWAREVDQKHGVNPVVEPYVTELHFEEGEPFTCDLVYEVAPQVPPIPDYATAVEVPEVTVPDERVGKTLESLRERAATLRPVEGEAQEGDYAEVNLLKKGQSKPFPLFRMATQGGDHPLDAQLLGKREGETFPLTVEAPSDPKARTLAPGDYAVTVTRLARREVPPLDDELAKHFGAESLADLKEKVRADMEADAHTRSKRIQEEKIVSDLLERHPFPVPPTLAERQLRGDLEELAGSLAQSGVDPSASLDWAKVAESRKPEAERRVRTYYLLESLVEREKIQLPEEELDVYFAERARAAGKPEVTAKSLRDTYAREGRLDSVRRLLLHRKALDLLLSKASVTFAAGNPKLEEGPR